MLYIFFLFLKSFPWAPAFCRVSPTRANMMLTQEAQSECQKPQENSSIYQCDAYTHGKGDLIRAITISLNLYFFHIGHKHPYGIKMSHLPSTTLLPQTPEDSISPSTLQESLLLEQGFAEMQGRFILKPRHPAQNEQGRGEPLPFLQVSSLGSCLHSCPQIEDTELTLSVGGGEEQ